MLPVILAIGSAGIPTGMSRMHMCALHSPILEGVIPVIAIAAGCCWTFRAKTRGEAWTRVTLVFVISIVIQFAYITWLHSDLFPDALLAPGLITTAEEFSAYPIKEVTDCQRNDDGLVINYNSEDGSRWNLTYNKCLEFKDNPEVYETLTILKNDTGSKYRPQVIKNGSKEEGKLLILLNDFVQRNIESDKSIGLETIRTILKEKQFDQHEDIRHSLRIKATQVAPLHPVP